MKAQPLSTLENNAILTTLYSTLHIFLYAGTNRTTLFATRRFFYCLSSMFLTAEQRRRKDCLKKDQAKKRNDIDAAHKLLRDRAQRDSWAQETPATPSPSIHTALSLIHI